MWRLSLQSHMADTLSAGVRSTGRPQTPTLCTASGSRNPTSRWHSCKLRITYKCHKILCTSYWRKCAQEPDTSRRLSGKIRTPDRHSPRFGPITSHPLDRPARGRAPVPCPLPPTRLVAARLPACHGNAGQLSSPSWRRPPSTGFGADGPP